MNEFDFLARLSSEPVAITIFLILVFKTPIATAMSWIWCKITQRERKRTMQEIFNELKKDIENIKKDIADEKQERLKRQAELDEMLINIRKCMTEYSSDLNEFYADLNAMKSLLSENEAYMDSISQGTLVQMLNDKGMKPKHRARAFIRLVALGVNGRTRMNGINFVFETEANKEAFLDAVEDIKYLNLKIKDQGYFDGVLGEINQRITDLSRLPGVSFNGGNHV